MSLITIPEVEPGVPAETMLRESVAVRDFMLAGKSGATKRAYRTDWNSFTSWCRSRGIEPLGAAPGMVATYLAAEAMSGRKPSTIARRAAAIRYAHTLSGLDSPTVSHEVGVTLQGIRRTLGTAPGQKTAATAALVRLMADQIPPGVRGERDRAIIILGFAGAFRRSELVALNVSDIREEADGLRIMIRESKGDQEKAGQEIVIPRGTKLRPVQALREWLSTAGIVSGPIFRRITKSGRVTDARLGADAVAVIVKNYAGLAGLDAGEFAAHSLRAGFLTSAAEGGANIFKMMETSRHKNMQTLKTYVRRADMFRDHAGGTFL